MINNFIAYLGASYIRGLTVTEFRYKWGRSLKRIQVGTDAIYPMKYAHCFVVPCLVVVISPFYCIYVVYVPISSRVISLAWWLHRMEIFFVLLAICAGNFPVTGEFPLQRPVTRSFGVFFDLRLNKWLGKQSWGWWFEMPSCPLWRQCNVEQPYDCVTGPLSPVDSSRKWSLMRIVDVLFVQDIGILEYWSMI